MEAIKNRPTPHLLGGPKGPLTLASDGPMASVCWTNSRPFVALCLFIGVLLPAFQTPRLLSRFLSELPCIGRSSRGVCLCGMEASCSPHCSTIYAPSSLSLSPSHPLSVHTTAYLRSQIASRAELPFSHALPAFFVPAPICSHLQAVVQCALSILTQQLGCMHRVLRH